MVRMPANVLHTYWGMWNSRNHETHLLVNRHMLWKIFGWDQNEKLRSEKIWFPRDSQGVFWCIAECDNLVSILVFPWIYCSNDIIMEAWMASYGQMLSSLSEWNLLHRMWTFSQMIYKSVCLPALLHSATNWPWVILLPLLYDLWWCILGHPCIWIVWFLRNTGTFSSVWVNLLDPVTPIVKDEHKANFVITSSDQIVISLVGYWHGFEWCTLNTWLVCIVIEQRSRLIMIVWYFHFTLVQKKAC
jgi:hypothetical protein